MSQNREESLQGIAIVGMTGRFPGARNIEQFWMNLENGVESITFFTEEELEAAGVDPALRNHPHYVKAGAVLEEEDHFDAAFFDMIPREAEITDPQQRLFLECAWSALEDAGYDAKTYDGRIGVYGGVGRNSYVLRLLANPDVIESVGQYQAIIGNDPDFVATRVSYKLNLSGPAVTVQTACSTSLVATHLACQSLLTYECDMAMAGGVAVKDPQHVGYLHQEGSIFSPDGHCRTFDEQAQGTVVGNGVGVVILKRLEDAVADGDHIYAVIKGSALNNDGSQKVGFTAPSVDQQAQVITDALAIADVEPESISYVEAHGTGTTLGDPIEIAALTSAYRTFTEQTGFCAIGSVKTNIGHLDTAAGVTGLIKTALSLKNKKMPPSLHFTVPNPKIDFANSPFYVNTELKEWVSNGEPRRAGVSSFGIGGTNAHMILEEAPERSDHREAEASRTWKLLTLSAKTSTALDKMTANLAEHLQQHPDLDLADVAYTLHVGRRDFAHRRTLVCRDHADALQALTGGDATHVHTRADVKGDRSVTFLFPGQGSQYVNMGLELYHTEPTYREQIDICAELLQPHLGLDIREVIYPSADKAVWASKELNETYLTQPAIFVTEYALARLWMEWGVQPQAMIGHSIGEYTVAVLAGVLSLEDALRLLANRARLMQGLPRGAMLAVSLTEQDVQPLLNAELSVAAVNGPSACVIAGEIEAVETLQALLQARGVLSHRLETSHAFHSPMMEPILDEFLTHVRSVTLHAPTMPYLSSVTGKWITAEEVTDPQYWVKQLRQGVRFADGVRELLQEEDRILLEVGPGRVLGALAKKQALEEGTRLQAVHTSLRHRDEQQSDTAFLLNSLGHLWLNGVEVEAKALYQQESRRRVPLPTYPFERKHFALEAGKPLFASSSQVAGKLANMADWFYTPVWKQTLPPMAPVETTETVHWLVFVDEADFATKIVTELKQYGQQVVAVVAGDAFGQIGEQTYSVRLGAREDYSALLKELATQGQAPQKIVHAWSVQPLTNELEFLGEPKDRFAHSQERGFYSLLFLAQALGEQGLNDALEIIVVTNNLQEVSSEEIVFPERATVFGACKVIPQEYAHITSRSLDIVLPPTGSPRELKLVGQLVAELMTETTDEVIAYRGRQRFTRAFEKARLQASSKPSGNLRQGGVYLVTGASAEAGLLAAQYLTQTAQAKLILVARDVIVQDKLNILQQLGTEMMVCQADVTDIEQMQAVIEQAQSRFGTIHGVIQAEETVGSGLIQLKTREMLESVLLPNVQGMLVLEAVTQELTLDFVLLFSRMQSITGGFGQVDNCAANAFLDTYARYVTAQTGAQATSVDWGIWQFDDWQGAQATLLPEVQKQLQQMQEQYGISKQEGLEALGRILASDLPQVVVSTQDFQDVLAGLDVLTASNYLDLLKRGSDVNFDPNRPYVAPTNEIEEKVASIWQETFGIEVVSIHDNFFELGGNSLLAVQLVSRLRNKFDIDLPMSALFDSATVAELSGVIAANQLNAEELDEIERMLAEIEAMSSDELGTKLSTE